MNEIELPEYAPVMVLPNATLFPHSILPLYIFEPRYRQMLSWALENHRMFCIALIKPGVEEAKRLDQFYHTGGIGFIRACVAQPDGTSHLLLQGLSRVKFTGFRQLEPFRIANLQPLPNSACSSKDEALADEVRRLCAEFRKHGFPVPPTVEEHLNQMRDPDQLADAVSHSFVTDSEQRQMLLETVEVGPRLRALAEILRGVLNGA